MKVLLLTLLLLLCSTQVLTLMCYTCRDETDNVCKEETECQPSANFCRTVEHEGDIVSRSCEEFCVPSDFTTCCEDDLC